MLAAESLGKIDSENPVAIATLVELIDSDTDGLARFQAADSLEKILTKSLMPKVVNILKNTKHEEAVKVLWHCAQNLSYPEFYSAWHSQE
ncbi:MAG: HEAT repeat domain-containing protein [Hydrococcus sp. Prado102]|jgi:HEAT repeat protein|nr:HEAT repeat domain-containing protein [Hydrococcus sp. Prado102]